MKVGFSACMIQGGKTGVAQYVLGLLREMVLRPDCPELTLFVLEDDLPLFGFLKERVRLVPVHERFRPGVAGVVWHQTFLPNWARRDNFDVVHVPSYRRMLWRKPCPLVATIHDLAPFHLPGKYDPARMFYGRVVARALARRQDRIIAVSKQTARDIERFFGIPESKVRVILNGLDHTRFCPGDSGVARAEAAKRWGLDRPFFLYVSRLEHPGKNHVRLVEAYTRFRETTGSDWLLALGGSRWHGAEAIDAAVQASPSKSDIRLLGFVADDELPTLYRAAGAVVYPSLFEGFGFPPVEAMACSCPVLSSRRGALAEVIGEAAGVLDPENAGQMQEQLTRIATDAKWQRQLREAGLSNAKRFSWAENVEQVLRCYREAARAPRVPGF